ncbi:Cd2+/Zn2+-exporting ATPase [Alkalispirochaeta americana]|uniref:P-type Zn(2+) transporter n=1 Tax=Alkalispirochaeta americana TaxID=159291 RepID=A0A1N6QFF3_9SPIO|nr:heavy metal translocating P-type ATPase [Alkalispirochaeta americana]SIQ15314.1 Cd2+/Zn2+-exporting ATPase [Alkalispirochaeta americana]
MNEIKTFRVAGLSCSNCAALIEEAAGKLPGVAAASVHIGTGVLRLEKAEQHNRENQAPSFDQLDRLVRSIEPGASLLSPSGEDDQAPVAEGAPGDAQKKHGFSLRSLDSQSRVRFALTGSAAGFFLLGFLVDQPLLFVVAYVLAGFSVILRAGRTLLAGRPLDESMLMTVATLGAWFLGEGAEAAAVMVFYQVGDTLQAAAVQRSRGAVKSLLDLRPATARLLQGDEESLVAAGSVREGDLLVCLPGERVPVDGVLEQGCCAVDTSAITGESLPRRLDQGDAVRAGSVVTDARVVIRAVAEESESTVARMISLVEEAASRKARTEQIMTRLARVYTPLVVVGAVILAVLPPLAGFGSFSLWGYRALVFLVVSCPCALVVSIPLAYFAGIGAASRRGILVKGGSFLDVLAGLTRVVFDKTGTVTTGSFAVSQVVPAPGVDRQELVEAAFRAARSSNHPVSRGVVSFITAARDISVTTEDLETRARQDEVRETPGRGTTVFPGEDSVIQEVIRGGSARHLREEAGLESGGEGDLEGSPFHVARGDRYLGYLLLNDELRPGVVQAVERLRSQGIGEIFLFSGDSRKAVERVGSLLGVDRAMGELLPHQKVQEMEGLVEEGIPGGIAFLGDGINDAAVIARADLGVSLGGAGSDAAVEAADLVLMGDDPGLLSEGIGIARRTRSVVFQNIVAALGIKAAVMVAAALGVASLWMAVFADVGVTVLTVLNTLRILLRPRR